MQTVSMLVFVGKGVSFALALPQWYWASIAPHRQIAELSFIFFNDLLSHLMSVGGVRVQQDTFKNVSFLSYN